MNFGHFVCALALLAGLVLPAAAKEPSGCPPAPALENMAALAAKARDHGFLWKLRKDGRTSWLYGTIHLARAEWVMPGPRVLEALRGSDTVALELDLSDPQTLAVLSRKTDPALAMRILGPDLAGRLATYVERSCAPAILKTQRPIMQVMSLALLEIRRQGLFQEFAIDGVLTGLARGARKELVALETASSQLAALVPEKEGQEREIVARALDQIAKGDAQQTAGRLARIWAEGDERALQDYPRWCECLETEAERTFYKRLLDDRNPPMADKLVALHDKGRQFFAGVGALHLVGPGGIVALMRARGFTVERVRFAKE